MSVSLNGQVVLGYAFNAATVDGNFGLLAKGGNASFDDVRIKTDDPAFRTSGGAAQVASGTMQAHSGDTLTQSELDAIASVAMSAWTEALGDGDSRLAGFGDVRIGMADLAGGELGYTSGKSILIDANAAGAGWNVDLSSVQGSHMDLVSVVEHELGHVLGFGHEDADRFAVMREDLGVGTRYSLFSAASQPAAAEPVSSVAPAFDAFGAQLAGVPNATIDWQASASDGWSVGLSPYAPAPAVSASGNFPSFVPGSASQPGKTGTDAGYDRLGRDLLGKRPGKPAA